VENPDGTFTIEGKTYDSLSTARAYLDLLKGMRA